jgi:hypothetical protein
VARAQRLEAIAADVDGLCVAAVNNEQPASCVMDTPKNCSTDYGAWQGRMVNRTSIPVYQDDGSVWKAVGAGADDLVLYDALGKVYAFLPLTLVDVLDDDGGGVEAVKVISRLATTAAAAESRCSSVEIVRTRVQRATLRGGVFGGGFLCGAMALYLASRFCRCCCCKRHAAATTTTAGDAVYSEVAMRNRESGLAPAPYRD